jgi:hypothetical protein
MLSHKFSSKKLNGSAPLNQATISTKSGTRRLEARTRDAKTILVVGNRAEFDQSGNARAAEVQRDTFELFRRNTRNLEIMTFDELFDRAEFITKE